MAGDMNRELPSISAIVPLYNGRPFVTAAIRSIVNQTVPPLELIVIDDGSTDGSDEDIAVIDAPFPVKVIRQENRGQSAARNEGVRNASGEFIAFLDQDDEWRAAHLEVLGRHITRSPDIGWAYGDFDEVDALGRTVTRGFINQSGAAHPKHTLAHCLSGDLMILPSASLMRTEAYAQLDGFDERLCGYEDDDLFLRMFRADWAHAYVPKSITRFRVHAISASAGRRFLRSRMIYLDKLLTSIADDERLNRHWVRDLVVPRFFQTTVEDYVRAIADRDWEYAVEASRAADRLAAMLAPSWRRRAELKLLAKPQLCRRALRALDFVPPSVRLPINPALRLQRRSRYG